MAMLFFLFVLAVFFGRHRFRRKSRGPIDAIGWMKKPDFSFPPVTDETERFLPLLGRTRYCLPIQGVAYCAEWIPERAIILLKGLWLGLIMQGDIQSVEDLTYGNRKDFIARYPLPKELPIVSFHTKASTDGSGLCKMSTIWKLATPLLRGIKVPLAIPMAAAMAFCASYLKQKYGGESDGLVMRVDAEVPGSAVVKLDVKLHHGWMVFRSSGTKGNNPNPSQMCEALSVLLLEEAATKSGSSSAHARTSKDANSNPDYLSAEISAGKGFLTGLQETYSGYDGGE